MGHWHVAHRRLKHRLQGNDEWETFAGTCDVRKLMGGFGNVDDNVVELPAGIYRAAALRAFDPTTREWSIWWLDGRAPGHIGEPVRGSFVDGVGTFVADEDIDGRPVRVRFRWSHITSTSAVWEQAFSEDAGRTWEMNWHMDFVRA